jgi:hypothetical protein
MPSQAKPSQVDWSMFVDVLEFSYPNPDDPRFARVHKKGFLDELRNASEEEILELSKLFVVWRDRKLRELPVLEFEDGKIGVAVPRVRALNKDHYAWVRELDLPRMYYRLVTLTLYRELGIIYSWANINRWISACLHRVRVKLKRDYGVDVLYLWVVEVHRDGFPHTHILFGLSRYVPELTFEVLLKIFQDAWVDEGGRPLCAPQGVDIRYIGRDVEKVKAYVLEYLVKDHWEIWAVEVENGLVRARLSAMLIWLFRVRLFGMSQKIKRVAKPKKSVVYHGRVSLRSVYRRIGYDVPYEEFKREFLQRGMLKFESHYLPVLVPSVARRGVDVDPKDEDLLAELMERF